MFSRNEAYCPALPSSIALQHRLATEQFQRWFVITYTDIDNIETSTERGTRQLAGASGRRRAREEKEAERDRGQRPAGRRAEEEAEESQEGGRTKIHRNWAGGKGEAIELGGHVQSAKRLFRLGQAHKVNGDDIHRALMQSKQHRESD